jgi:ubiquinone/menaquinone biosynthesis C-methylase UbiE
MSEGTSSPAPASGAGGPDVAAAASSELRINVIRAVTNPLGFFVLVVLIVEVILGTLVGLSAQQDPQRQTLVVGMLALIFFLVILVAGMATFRPDALYGLVAGGDATQNGRRPPAPNVDTTVIEKRLEKTPEIAGETAPEPAADVWEEELRPVLHQAIQYTVPTYYLDVNLRMIDWNLAFELVFSRCASSLRGKHVKHFIAQLANFDEVIAHAQQFTRQVFRGQVPYVDVEPLKYGSEKYGPVSFIKVAAQLHDAEGHPRGWSVSLLIREINWEAFQNDLFAQARQDKLWSVYSAAYDRVLLEFPPYHQLIADVIAVVPAQRLKVVDLGAGSGNVTAALLKCGHRVTAVDNNQAMLDRLRSKDLPRKHLTVVKSSVENMKGLADGSFDAAVMVNVLYSVADPLTCLQEVQRILRPGGVLGLSTTHAEVDLDPLLDSIKARLMEIGKYDALAGDFKLVQDANRSIEKTIAKRHTREQYREWVRAAGFEITRDVPSTYEDAVMLIHARKR